MDGSTDRKRLDVRGRLRCRAGLTGVFFYDIGQAEDQLSSAGLLSDVGIGFRWQSPLGLLRFEWGWPVSSDNLDRDTVNFEFSIGPPF